MTAALLHIWGAESLDQLFPPGHRLAIEIESGLHFLQNMLGRKNFKKKSPNIYKRPFLGCIKTKILNKPRNRMEWSVL